MKTVTIADIPSIKIQNREGLYQKDIFDEKDGARHFTFHYSLMEKGGHGQLHSHPHSEHVLMVAEGSLVVRNDKESHALSPGMAILIMPTEEHEIINSLDGRTVYYVIYAPPR